MFPKIQKRKLIFVKLCNNTPGQRHVFMGIEHVPRLSEISEEVSGKRVVARSLLFIDGQVHS